MTFVPTGYAHVVMPLQLVGQTRPMAVTWGAGDGTMAALQASADTIYGDVIPALQPILDSNLVVGPLTVNIAVAPNATVPFVAGPQVTGTDTKNSLPCNSALLVRKNTTTPGRKGRGRMYLPVSLSELDVDERGIITGATVSAQQARFDIWLANAGSGQFRLVVLHDDAGTPPSPVTSFSVQNLIANQRRRLGR